MIRRRSLSVLGRGDQKPGTPVFAEIDVFMSTMGNLGDRPHARIFQGWLCWASLAHHWPNNPPLRGTAWPIYIFQIRPPLLLLYAAADDDWRRLRVSGPGWSDVSRGRGAATDSQIMVNLRSVRSGKARLLEGRVVLEALRRVLWSGLCGPELQRAEAVLGT